MTCGIYKITNIIDNKFYIGSSIDIERIWYKHKKDLNNNKHHSILLQRSWNKYSEENFVFEIIEECLKEIIVEREQWYLDQTQCYDSKIGYNIAEFAQSSMLGKNHSEETKEKISKNNAKYWKGKPRSEETKEKMSKANRGKYYWNKCEKCKEKFKTKNDKKTICRRCE